MNLWNTIGTFMRLNGTLTHSQKPRSRESYEMTISGLRWIWWYAFPWSWILKYCAPPPSPKFSNTFCILDRVSVWDGFALELIIEELMIMRYSFFWLILLAKSIKMKRSYSSPCCKDFKYELFIQHTEVLEQSGNWVGLWSCLAV